MKRLMKLVISKLIPVDFIWSWNRALNRFHKRQEFIKRWRKNLSNDYHIEKIIKNNLAKELL